MGFIRNLKDGNREHDSDSDYTTAPNDHPGKTLRPVSVGERLGNEIGNIARAFDGYVERLREKIQTRIHGQPQGEPIIYPDHGAIGKTEAAYGATVKKRTKSGEIIAVPFDKSALLNQPEPPKKTKPSVIAEGEEGKAAKALKAERLNAASVKGREV